MLPNLSRFGGADYPPTWASWPPERWARPAQAKGAAYFTPCATHSSISTATCRAATARARVPPAASGVGRGLLHDGHALAQQGFARRGGSLPGWRAGAAGPVLSVGAGEEVAEFFQLNAQHGGRLPPRAVSRAWAAASASCSTGRRRPSWARRALLHQLHGRLGPAGQGVGAQLLGVGVVQGGTARRCCFLTGPWPPRRPGRWAAGWRGGRRRAGWSARSQSRTRQGGWAAMARRCSPASNTRQKWLQRFCSKALAAMFSIAFMAERAKGVCMARAFVGQGGPGRGKAGLAGAGRQAAAAVR